MYATSELLHACECSGSSCLCSQYMHDCLTPLQAWV